MRKRLLNIVLAILFIAIGSVGTYLFLMYFSGEELTIKNVSEVEIVENSISEAVNKVYNSVYVIESYKGLKVSGTGTGFIYKLDDKYAYLLTNEHVINGSGKVNAVDLEENEYEATVLGSDVFLDIAVLRIEKNENMKAVIIGNSEDLELGDTLFTIGSPLGREYIGTVTKGILSGKDRLVEVSLSGADAGDWLMKVIQTDAAINPGNSGGPLANINGEVIGINSLKYVLEEVEGMGFAIPIEYAMKHVDALEKGETIDRPLLGVQLLDLEETYSLYRSGITLDASINEGVVVESILNDTPASKAGLQKGDIITKIDNEALSSKAYLRYILYKYNINDTIKITYYRGNKLQEVNIKLDKVYTE